MEVTVTLTDPKIYVGSELADDDCARESVWQHEVLHYRIDQDVLERFTPTIQRTVEFAVKQAGSQVAKRESDVERIGERMARTVRQHLDRASRDMQSERDRLHDRHDFAGGIRPHRQCLRPWQARQLQARPVRVGAPAVHEPGAAVVL